MRRFKRKFHYMPIMEIDNDAVISKLGAFTIGFELTRPEVFTLSTAQFEAYHQVWVKAIQSLPPDTILHVQDWFIRMQYEADTAHHERPYMKHQSFLYLTRIPTGSKASPSLPAIFSRKEFFPPDILDPAITAQFLQAVGQFENILKDGGFIETRRLTTQELASTKTEAGLVERYYSLSMDPGHRRVADITFKPELRIGDAYTHVYTFADPEHLPPQSSSSTDYRRYSTDRSRFSLGFASPLGLLMSVNHIYNQYIFIDNPQTIQQSLEQKLRRHQSLANHSRSNALAGEAINAFLNEGLTEQRTMIKAHFNVLAWDNDEDALDLHTQVCIAMAHMGGIPHQETISAPYLWAAGIPGNAGDLPVTETYITFAEQAACFLVSETNYRSSLSPFGIRLGDRLTGRPIHVDLSDEPKERGWIHNRNKFVLGGSGSGKSFFINHLLRSYYEQGVHSVVVDIGGSYSGLAEWVNGYYFKFSETDPIRFNPFWLPEGELLDIEKKESLKSLLVALWKKEDEEFLRSEYVALSNALQLYYIHLEMHPEIFPCFNSFYEFLQERFIDVLAKDQVKEKDFDIHNFLYVLRPYYAGGEYDYLLNATEQLDLLQQRFIVFELDNIKDHPILFPAVTIIIMEVFINKMRKLEGVRKVIVIEEAWKALTRQGMSEYIQYCFRTVRKFFGEAIVVTQEVEDIISNPIVKQTIINNADCKILLDQSKFQNRFDEIQDILGLNDRDKALVLSLNRANTPGHKYKEVFIGLGPKSAKVYRTQVSLEEQLAYTTEESEKMRVKEYSARHGGIRQGIAALAKDLREGKIKLCLILALALSFLFPAGHTQAQVPIADIIKEAVKKVLIATDLEIQRMQTQTVVLQDAQKMVENIMQSMQLSGIAGWVQQQKDLYGEYFQELWTVKSVLTDYQEVAAILNKQARLVAAYKQATAAMREDPHFSPDEIGHMERVYDGILGQSIQNITQLGTVINSFLTQMDDAGRLHIIDATGRQVNESYNDLQRFTQDNILLSMQRCKDQQDGNFIRSLYGISSSN